MAGDCSRTPEPTAVVHFLSLKADNQVSSGEMGGDGDVYASEVGLRTSLSPQLEKPFPSDAQNGD